MSVSISSGGGGGGITIETDPTALKIANNLADLADPSQAIVNLGAIDEAPNDGTSYVRNGGLWVNMPAPSRNLAAEAANALACATQYLSVVSGWDESVGSFYSGRWVGHEDGVAAAIVTNIYAFAPAPFFNSSNSVGNGAVVISYGIAGFSGGNLVTDGISYFDNYGWLANFVSNFAGGQMYMYASTDGGLTKEISFSPVNDFV